MSRKEKGGNAVRATRKQLLGRASIFSMVHAQPKVNSQIPRHPYQYRSDAPPADDFLKRRRWVSDRKQNSTILTLDGFGVPLDGDQRGKIYGGCQSMIEN